MRADLIWAAREADGQYDGRWPDRKHPRTQRDPGIASRIGAAAPLRKMVLTAPFPSPRDAGILGGLNQPRASYRLDVRGAPSALSPLRGPDPRSRRHQARFHAG